MSQLSIQIPSQNVTVTIPTSSQRGVDGVNDIGLDNTGVNDCAPLLQAWLNGLTTPTELHLAIGKYYFKSGIVTNGNLIKIVGDGQTSNVADGDVTICSDQPLKYLFWFNTPASASNLQSVWLEHLQFKDTSVGHNQVASMIRITNQANIHLSDVGGLDLVPQRYATGTVSVANGSKSVIGTGTSWSDSMVPGFVVIAGYPYEIASIQSPTALTLAIAYQGTTSLSALYAINSGGILLWGEPGLGFTQYGQVTDLKSHNVGFPVYMSAGTGATGTSRIKFLSGYVNGGSIPDGIAAYFGPFSDTMGWHVASNSFAFGVVIASGHMHDISSADFENAGLAPPITGGAAGYAGAKGVLVMGDNSSNTWGNRVINNQMRQIGNAIELYGMPGNAPDRTKVAFNVFRSNTVNFTPGNATNTWGEIDGVFHGISFTT